MTIDKFFNRILRLFCFYDGINIDFSTKENIKELAFLNFYLSSISYENIQEIISIGNILQTGLGGILDIFFILLERNYEKLDFIDNNFIIDGNLDNKILDCIGQLKQIVVENEKSSPSAKNAFKDVVTVEDVLTKSWIKKDCLSEYLYFKKIYTPIMGEVFSKLKDLIYNYCQQKQIIVLSKLLRAFNLFKSKKKEIPKTS